ncbi:hypothetical protein L596_012211 [Steinernema carpocapsae]|uniref:Uncharacterized protein n=1 Tax=Steinernema carpocapsae TaxID=34508 RepID=A0A4U5NWF9_STECR|nr:hypothetical protein L596_012211 [Steinernema carpocapsae]
MAFAAAALSHEERQWREAMLKSQEALLQNQVRFEKLLKDKKRKEEYEEQSLAAINTLSGHVARLCGAIASFENSFLENCRSKTGQSKGSSSSSQMQ